MAGKKELPEEVFWRDLEEITSHARPVARSATETGRMKEPVRNRREREISLFLAGTRARRGAGRWTKRKNENA